MRELREKLSISKEIFKSKEELEYKIEETILDFQRKISEILEKFESDSSKIILALQALQNVLGYLPKEAIIKAAEKMGVPISHAYGVATFYHQFRLKPVGRHIVHFCFGTACHLKGAESIYNAFLKAANMNNNENTSKDNRFTIHKVRCFGACSMAPIVKIDNDIYGKITPSEIRKIISKYK
ncbi:MAG: NAD(P)H-dependent oxidoreductase subunit E [Nitrososphaerota archaeon]